MNVAQKIAVSVMLVAEAVFLIGWGWSDGSFLYGWIARTVSGTLGFLAAGGAAVVLLGIKRRTK